MEYVEALLLRRIEQLKSEVASLSGTVQVGALDTVLADKQPFIGAVKLYNPTTGKYHTVFVDGDENELHIVFGAGENHP